MIRQDLIAAIVSKTGISEIKSRQCVDVVLESITDALLVVNASNFGSLERSQAKCISREKVATCRPARKWTCFRPES